MIFCHLSKYISKYLVQHSGQAPWVSSQKKTVHHFSRVLLWVYIKFEFHSLFHYIIYWHQGIITSTHTVSKHRRCFQGYSKNPSEFAQIRAWMFFQKKKKPWHLNCVLFWETAGKHIFINYSRIHTYSSMKQMENEEKRSH